MIKSYFLPISGPNNITKRAFPIKCQPKAAGNCSNEKCSETVKVKLLKAAPRKNALMDNQTNNCVHSVCSAITK